MRSGRQAGEKGAAALEFALVAPLLFVLLFGIIDFGLTINDVISLRQGSRDGARQAVVGAFGTDSDCSLAGEANTANTSTRQLICLTKDRVGIDSDRTRAKLMLGADGYTVGSPVAVCLQLLLTSTTGMFSPLLGGRVATTKVQMRIEQAVESASLQPTEETALPGGSWSFCTVS